MKFTTNLGAAAVVLASSVSAHMKMSSPKPMGSSTLNNSPLLADGSDFPCKQRPGVYTVDGAANVYPLGSQQQLSTIGQATHGGGSCQIVLTYDKEPTKDSVWRVLHSIQGGCPAKNTAGNLGNDASAASPDSYPYTIPSDIPTGDATIAWTWFNTVGNREMYMNCGRVTLTGSGGSQANFDKLPTMYVANLGAVSGGCSTTENDDLVFPDPGTSVAFGNGQSNPKLKIAKCGGKTGGSGSGSGSGTQSSAGASAPAAPSPTASKPASVPGGVFITASAPPAAAPTTAIATSVAAPVPTSAAASPAVTPSAGAGTGTGTGSGSGSGSGSSAGVMTGSCTTEGEWNCINGSSFQQCASGRWSVAMQMAAGTKCTPGKAAQMAILGAKRQIRSFRA